MTELEDRLRRGLQELVQDGPTEPARPLPPAADLEHGAPPVAFGSPGNRPASRRPVIAALIGLLAVGLLAVLLTTARDDPRLAPTPGHELMPGLAPGTAEVLPPAPIEGRASPNGVWSGREVIIWSGATIVRRSEPFLTGVRYIDTDVPLEDGAAFDPATRTWRTIAPAPIPGRTQAAVVWTGDEMVVWGGIRGGDNAEGGGDARADGAAYDPAADRWRLLAPAPLPVLTRVAGTWTGSELFVAGDSADGSVAAAYDPARDTWRLLPAPPDRLASHAPQIAAVDGAVLLLVGHDGGEAVARFDLSEARWYSPELLWRIEGGGAPMLIPGNAEAAWIERGGYNGRTVRLDAYGAFVSEHPLVPHQGAPVPPVGNGDELVWWTGGSRVVALQGEDQAVRPFVAPELPRRHRVLLLTADDFVFGWGGRTNWLGQGSGDRGAVLDDGVAFRRAATPRDTTLDSRAYVSTRVTRDGEVEAAYVTAPYTLSFSPSGMSDGCGARRPYDIQAGRLVVTEATGILMVCATPANLWLDRFLMSSPALRQEGSHLILTAGDDALELQRSV